MKKNEIKMETLKKEYFEMVEKYQFIYIHIKYEENGYMYRENITYVQFISEYFERLLKDEPFEIYFSGLN